MYKNLKEVEAAKIDDIVVLIKSMNTVTTRNGDVYQKLIVRDLDGNEGTFTKFDIMIDMPVPAIVQVTLDPVEYGSGLNMKIKECIEVDTHTMTEFLPKPHIDAREGWNSIAKSIKTVRNSLCRVLCSVIAEDKNRFITHPLNPTGAFARQSGILEATTKLVELAQNTASLQGLDRDLIVSAAILYYIGNLDTIDEGYNVTSIDAMYGPELTAYTKVQFKAKELIETNEDARKEINGEDVMMLSHILMCRGEKTNHTIPEAAVLKALSHMIEEVDEMQESLLSAEPNTIVNDNAHPNKRLYKASKSWEKTEEENLK